MEFFDVYLLEAILNGLLLGGLLALLSLGLNLIFGVIDVVWICYAELIMCGMYAVYYLHVQYHWPLAAAMPAAVLIVAALGVVLHQYVIRPVLAAEPINQLLVTGGVLFFLQAAATLAFGIDFKNLGVSLPAVRLGEVSFSAARLVAFGAALTGAVGNLFAVVERYPTLRASQSFLLLQEQLTSTENRIAFARQHYNEAVRQYNTALAEFPRNLIAGVFGFSASSLFAANAGDRGNVHVEV